MRCSSPGNSSNGRCRWRDTLVAESDFGVLTDGRTMLVEVNEGYSINPYGLEATEYSAFLEARWTHRPGCSSDGSNE